MKTIQEYLSEYGAYHTDPINVRYHLVGVPMIMLSLVGMLDHWVWLNNVAFGAPLTAGLVLLVGANLFYLALHRLLGLSMVIVTVFMYWLSLRIPFAAHVAIFVVAWILQLKGHKIEGRKPAFLENIVHLFIGPLFVQNEILSIVED